MQLVGAMYSETVYSNSFFNLSVAAENLSENAISFLKENAFLLKMNQKRKFRNVER